MTLFSSELFVSTLALVGAVIIISALLSGVIERTRLPQVGVFLAIGAVIGPFGLGLFDVPLDSPVIRVVATLCLALVLFTDALSLNLVEVRRHWFLAFLVLGPGTLVSAALIAIAAWWLLELSPAMAAILGAGLASTDPVLLRGILKRSPFSTAARQALRLESALNDVVLLPVVLVAITIASGAGDAKWSRLFLNMFLLSPGAGVVLGLFAVGSLELVRKRFGVRRDYESLYSLGIAFAAFAAAEAMHGSGFIAAFAAGLTIIALDVELCDCFLEYGETTAEMALLFAFVIFGCSIIWSGFEILNLPVALFTLLIFALRPLAFLPALTLSGLQGRERLLIAWFGPRGLSSLLLVLLPVFAGIPESVTVVQLTCLVVLLSVVLHGGTAMALFANADAIPAPARLPVQDNSPRPPDAPMVSTSELKDLLAQQNLVTIFDFRREQAYDGATIDPVGAIHLSKDDAIRKARELNLSSDAPIISFCACPEDFTAREVTKDLIRAGFKNARALEGGWKAWQADGLPVSPR